MLTYVIINTGRKIVLKRWLSISLKTAFRDDDHRNYKTVIVVITLVFLMYEIVGGNGFFDGIMFVSLTVTVLGWDKCAGSQNNDRQTCNLLIFPWSRDCSLARGRPGIGQTEVRGAGLELFWKSTCVAHLSRLKQRRVNVESPESRDLPSRVALGLPSFFFFIFIFFGLLSCSRWEWIPVSAAVCVCTCCSPAADKRADMGGI